MPLPTPDPNERRDAFIRRCVSDEKLRQEFPDADQRVAVCNAQWRRAKDSDADSS